MNSATHHRFRESDDDWYRPRARVTSSVQSYDERAWEVVPLDPIGSETRGHS